MRGRSEIENALAGVRGELDRLAAATPDSAWSRPAYEGWTAKQLLCHVASTSGLAGFVLNLAKLPPSAGGAGGRGAFDIDAFNAQQVAMREERPVADIFQEARANLERDVESVREAADDLLSKHFRAPWEIEGTVAEVIAESIRGHLMMHLRDLAAALA